MRKVQSAGDKVEVSLFIVKTARLGQNGVLTFALGTAAGDLVAEQFGLGYLATGILFGMIIVSLTAGYFLMGLDAILGFWLAYIFTRPLGASFGDVLSQPIQYGGLGLGTVITSVVFLAAIAGIVASVSVGRKSRDYAR